MPEDNLKRYIIVKNVELPKEEKFHDLQADDQYQKIADEQNLGVPMAVVPMTEEEAQKVQELPQVYSVQEEKTYSLPQPIEPDGENQAKDDQAPFDWAEEGNEANSLAALRLLGVDKCRDAGLKGDGVVVSVLDTGLDRSHAQTTFTGRIKAGQSFVGGEWYDGHGHGTHCAGTVAGPDDIGVAPNARLLIGKVLGDNGSGSDSGIIKAINWSVAQGAHVISLSLGGDGDPNDALSMAINQAWAQGVVCVCAAGNDGCLGRDLNADRQSPGCAREAISVAACDLNRSIASFSSCGTTVDITALGVRVISLGLNGQSGAIMSGTSMATPHVAGIAALFKQTKSNLEIRNAMYATAQGIGEEPINTGHGLVNAEGMRLALEPPKPEPEPQPAPSPAPGPTPEPEIPVVTFYKLYSQRKTLQDRRLQIKDGNTVVGDYIPKGDN